MTEPVQLLYGADAEWEKMYNEYIARVPSPVFRTDPPIKTTMEEQLKQEEFDFDARTDDEV